MNKSDIAPIIVGKLMNIGGMLRKNGDLILQPYSLNQQQFSVLFSIGTEEPVNQKEMVTKMLLEKAHVSKIVKKLHGLGLVRIAPCSEDKRSSWLSLTDKGKDVLRECRKLISKWNAEWTAEIKMEQLQILLDSLTQMQEVLGERS